MTRKSQVQVLKTVSYVKYRIRLRTKVLINFYLQLRGYIDDTEDYINIQVSNLEFITSVNCYFMYTNKMYVYFAD